MDISDQELTANENTNVISFAIKTKKELLIKQITILDYHMKNLISISLRNQSNNSNLLLHAKINTEKSNISKLQTILLQDEYSR